MAGTLGRSIELLKETWRILAMDRELLLFPVMSGAVILVILLSFFIPVFFLGLFRGIPETGPATMFILLYIFYFVSYAAVIFFNSGLITCARIRFSGGDPTVADGLRNAVRHLEKILRWAFVAATVGPILHVVSRRSGLLGKIAVLLTGVVWSLATFLVIPVLLFEEEGVIDAVREYWGLLKRTWGENIIVNASLGILVIPGLLMFFITIFSIMTGNIMVFLALGMVTVLCFVISGILHSAMQGIFVTALYLYARTGEMPGHFRGDLIRGAFARKEQGTADALFQGKI